MAVPIFNAPISTEAPLGLFPRRDSHPVSRSAIIKSDNQPIQTNKWYANFFLGNQTQPAFPLPYSLWITKDGGNYGMNISHIDASQLAIGPDANVDPVQYYLNPLGIRSMTFSATELNPSTSSVTVTSCTPHSCEVSLHADRRRYGDDQKRIFFPMVQGMGMVTARYESLVPVVGSGVFFRSITAVNSPRGGLQKWRALLENGVTWLIYACPFAGNPWLTLSPYGNDKLVGSSPFTGLIQVAKLPDPSLESIVDSAAGAYAVTTTISGSVDRNTGTYIFKHQRWGENNAGRLLMYALPHHLATFNPDTAARRTPLALQSPTKGLMWGVLSDDWVLNEFNLPIDISWLPKGGESLMTGAVATAVRTAAAKELQQDMDAQSNLNSMYFSGKALGKFAQIVLALALTGQDVALSRSGLSRLEAAIGRFANNRQIYPLVYDNVWKGLVSEAMYKTGDPNIDFGNSYYNDHHFHYAYFIYTAAVITFLERLLNNSTAWVTANRAWVNSLVRDVANPSAEDPHFPVSRAFDWWCGHSWAKGLFESADGKDQESSSEDYNFSYALSLWGTVTGDAAMAARGHLMTAIMRTSMNQYFLMSMNNRNHPPKFIKNKVTGILFENKCDHATYFGLNIEYIQGIHMIPLTPVSPYVRTASFCREEWEQWFSNGRTDNINDGWKGILWANVALFDPAGSWQFFNRPDFQDQWLDGGASKTWYLAFAGSLGGAPRY